ncbi:MAG: ATP-binding cassette domain-containing protein [Lachnospiraceae bacterium]|nr:ATP-binding cassette domain-containing protein [Lachnospiraceae bacterium]
MGWFDEQIKQRRDRDANLFSESMENIIGTIQGRSNIASSFDDAMKEVDAVNAILRYFGAKRMELTGNFSDFNEKMEYMLRPHGIMRRRVELTEGWYKDAIGPMVGFLKDSGRAIALIPGGLSGYYYIDTSTGIKKKVDEATAKMFDEDALVFYKPFPLRKLGIKDLIVYALSNLNVGDFVIYGAFSVAVVLLGLIMPRLTNILFSDIVDSGSYSSLMGIGIFMATVGITSIIISVMKNFCMTRIETKIGLNIEAAGMMRILSLPVSLFKEYSSGEMSNRLQYITSFINAVINMIISTGFSTLLSFAYIVQIFRYARSLVLPSLVVVIVNALLMVAVSLIQSKRLVELEQPAKESGVIYNIINGIQKVKLAGAEKRTFAVWAGYYVKTADAIYNKPLILRVYSVISTGISLVGTIIIYYEAVTNHVSVADYMSFNVAFAMVSAAITTAIGIVGSIAGLKPMYSMIKPIIDTEPEISEGKEVLSSCSGDININNVYFRYNEDMPYVLENLSLHIRKGDYVAIVGATGCGKSTLVRLLLGFEKPERGAIYYDAKDLKNIDVRSLRGYIGSVTQDGGLFQGDIYSNIVITSPHLTLKDAWEAAEIAGIAEDISEMPMGMNTIISEGQGGISGGQKQRLMIARAIVHKPRILILDEATSALDNITQKKVSDALDNLDCTRIVIAHRLSTIKNCKKIILLENGNIAEEGTYDELIARNGKFAELVERQKV